MRYINIDKVLSLHQNLHVEECDDHTPRRLSGVFVMNTEYNEICFFKQYSIDADLTVFPPYVIETKGSIPEYYPHRYKDGGLCLETDTRIITECSINYNEFDLEIWFNHFLIPFFFTFEYYNRFGEFPFGERSHGSRGIIEFYREHFGLSSSEQTIGFLIRVSKLKSYRGHLTCPCGSEKRIRNCHKDEVIEALNPTQKECIIKDLVLINNEIQKGW